MQKLLSTATVSREQRLAYWTDLICSMYVQLECDQVRPAEPGGHDGFEGRIRHCRLPGLDLSVVSSGPQKVRRTPRQIARSGDDCVMFSVQLRGRGVVRQDGRTAVLGRGEFALYDSTRPYELVFDAPFEQAVLKLPGEHLRAEMRETPTLTATTMLGREGPGPLLLGMIGTLRRQADALPPASARAVAAGMRSILVAGLHTLPAARAVEQGRLAAYHLARIKQHIDARLSDPTLSVDTLALHLGLSPSHIHRLFKGEPLTPARYIWECRLQACCRDLRDPRLAARPLADIAYGRGFSDAAHFSRAFRERFGCSPREWRQQGLDG